LELALVHRERTEFVFRDLEVRGKRRAVAPEELVFGDALRSSQSLGQVLGRRIGPGLFSLDCGGVLPGRLGEGVNRHEADVVRVDERSDHQKGPLVLVSQKRRARASQFAPLVARQKSEAERVEVVPAAVSTLGSGQVNLAAVHGLVTGAPERAA